MKYVVAIVLLVSTCVEASGFARIPCGRDYYGVASAEVSKVYAETFSKEGFKVSTSTDKGSKTLHVIATLPVPDSRFEWKIDYVITDSTYDVTSICGSTYYVKEPKVYQAKERNSYVSIFEKKLNMATNAANTLLEKKRPNK